jgi:hypothetical protein
MGASSLHHHNETQTTKPQKCSHLCGSQICDLTISVFPASEEGNSAQPLHNHQVLLAALMTLSSILQNSARNAAKSWSSLTHNAANFQGHIQYGLVVIIFLQVKVI